VRAEEESGLGPQVVVVEDVWGPAFDRLGQRVDITYQPDAWSEPEQLANLTRSASVLVVRNRTQVDRSLLAGAGSLGLVARAGVGLDNIDLDAADALGVVVCAALGANARSVAELAVGLALSVARDIPGHDHRCRQGRWDRATGVELAGRCWGVFGLGATGAQTCLLASALGLRTIGYDPYLAAGDLPPGLDRRVERPGEVLAEADVVSLHMPLTPDTSGLVDRDFLASMRPGSYLVNVGRGGLVDEAALLDALDRGHLGGAALDVRAEEPPAVGAIEGHPRVVLTPHVAGLTDRAQDRVVDALGAAIEDVLAGRPAAHAVGRRDRPGPGRFGGPAAGGPADG
jgi:D-3-phosphoglycerate dehydrogenase